MRAITSVPDELIEIIKTDEESQKKFQELRKMGKKRVIISAIVLAMATLISVTFVFYAAYKTKTNQAYIEELEAKVEQCEGG